MSKTKIVISSENNIEVYLYENGSIMNTSRRENFERSNTQQSRDKSFIRARNNLRRLAIANFSVKDSHFMTLTFRENLTSIEICNRQFNLFIKKLKYNFGLLKYIAVIEFQKRGAVHYHVLIHGLGRNPDFKKIIEIWANGAVFLTKIDHIDNLGAYLVKYMIKNAGDSRLCGKKSYFTSRNLKRPIEITGVEAENIVNDLDLTKSCYSEGYKTKNNGDALFLEFNFERYDLAPDKRISAILEKYHCLPPFDLDFFIDNYEPVE